ncbi:MAG: S8 family serine peptidase [Parcubacteria group bacterium]|nr:S8 family serine peptidase [Parcubacteria group bacterium]
MYKKPQFRFFLVLAAILAVFLAFNPVTAEAAPKGGFEGGRNFIASKSYIVKSLFGVQHEFSNGFTADLTSGEVWTLEKIFKIGVSPVPLYKVNNVSVSDAVDASSAVSEVVDILADKENPKDPAKVVKIRTLQPENTVPWGIKKIYNDSGIKATSGGKGVGVAVLDTGANIKHPDLIGRIKDCKDFTRGPVPRATCEDKNGHGTHVAGIIAADGGGDGQGVWGVAGEADLFIYKVCRNDGTCWADDVAAAVDQAVYANNINIINLGLGGNYESPILKGSLDEAALKNILVVAAAGNDGLDKGTIDWPAAYKTVVAVGAIADDGLVPDWSSRGINNGNYIIEDREIEFGAPGVNVESVWLDGGYRYLSGTSMAAPHVSGLAAKLWNGVATSTRALMQKNAKDIWSIGDDIATGLGLPQVPKMVIQ